MKDREDRGMTWPEAAVQIAGWLAFAVMVYSCNHSHF